MQPNRFVMRPVGSNQINPFFNQQMGNPANPQVSYQVNLQGRQSATMTMPPRFNPQMMHPLNMGPFPSANPQIPPPVNPQMVPNVNPQLMFRPTTRPSVNPQLMRPPPLVPPVSQMMPLRNPHIPSMNRLAIPAMNGPAVMPPVPPPNMIAVPTNIANYNSRLMRPTNCQSFQPVNSQNFRPRMTHMPPVPSGGVPPPMSQPNQGVNPPNYPPNVPNVNYPNMPMPRPVTPLGGQGNTPLVNPHTFPPPHNPQNIPPPIRPQTFPPSVTAQGSSNAEANARPKAKPKAKPSAKSSAKTLPKRKTVEMKKETPEKNKKERSITIFWEDPDYKKANIVSEKSDGGNTVTNGPENTKKKRRKRPKKTKKEVNNKERKEDMKQEEKKEGIEQKGKKVKTSDSMKGAASTDSTIKNTSLITIKAKGDKPMDEKRTEYFKNLRSSKIVSGKDHGKKKLSENDKTKAKILKIFALMQKLKGVSKKLWQNVAANGEFKDNPVVPEEVTKFYILTQKFISEVDCIVKLTKKGESSSNEKALKESKPQSKNSDQASSDNPTQTSSTVSKQGKQRKRKTVPVTVRLLLKKLNVLDDLGLCFVNINGIFIKRYCSVIVKLRKSLNALLDKSKTSFKKKRLKIPQQPCLPQWGAIMLTCYGNTSYANALHLASKKIKFKNFGIQCIKKRRSVTGGIILEVFAEEDYEEKTDKLAKKLQEVFESLEVRVTRPQKYGDLVISRLHPSATVEQVCEQLAKLGKCSANIFKTGSRGKTCMWVRCPLNIAIQLDQKTFEMESTVARINLKAQKLVRCYKCFNMGHVKHLCPSLFDHNNLCFKCGQSDHEARTCQNAPKCLTCYDNSLPAFHRLGGDKCPSAIPKFIKRQGRDGTTKKSDNLSKKGKGIKGKRTKKGKLQTGTISCLPSAPDQVRSRY